MIEMVELVRENITKDEILPAVSLVVTVGFIMIGGYVMSYLVKMEEESVQRQLGAKGLKVLHFSLILLQVSLVICGRYVLSFWTANIEFAHKKSIFD